MRTMPLGPVTDINTVHRVNTMLTVAVLDIEQHRDRTGWTGHFEATYAAQDQLLEAIRHWIATTDPTSPRCTVPTT